MLEHYLTLLELDYFEAPFAFEGLADENVWKRPAEGLLSIGELAGHIAHNEAMRLAATAEGCLVQSPLIDERFAYHPKTIAQPPTDAQRAMGAAAVCAEMLRVHRESVARLRERDPDPADVPPGMPEWTYGESLKYTVFHVAYHVGQMYSARHLLGDIPPDN